ncbi:MAG TPA: branched-chain amino acid ABC transporter permease [Steroidobacteraceae bacterium]|nr:branched-chain amino acid ABC transporter permease [Steroidobacteraceae bacterium]
MTDSIRAMVASRQLWIAFFGLAVLLTLPLWVSAYVLGVLTIAYYFGVFAMSWDLLFGFANEVNFGPTFLIGSGAYAAGLLNAHGVPLWLCLIAGAAAALLGGVVLAVPALRLTGPYFGLSTLVAVLLLQQFIIVFAGSTGGEIGLTMNDILSTEAITNYWYALAFMTVSGAILFALSRSPVGLILQASGQDRFGASALGFNVVKHKLAAFCISAVFSGLAGAMLVFYLGTASVGTVVDVSVGVQVIIAAVLGGRRTIVGAGIGAIFLILAGEALRPLGQLSTFVVSGVALLVILFSVDGLMGLLQRRRDES